MYCSYKKPIRHLDMILDCFCNTEAVHTNEKSSILYYGEDCIIETGKMIIGSCFWKTTEAELCCVGTKVGQLHLGQHQYQLNGGNVIRKEYVIIRSIN